MYVPPGQAPLREIKHPALPWDPATLSWFFPRQSSGHTGLWAAGTARLRGQGATVGGRERVPRGPGLRVGRSAQAAAACGQESPEAGEGTLPEVAATPGRPCHQELPGAAGCGQGSQKPLWSPQGNERTLFPTSVPAQVLGDAGPSSCPGPLGLPRLCVVALGQHRGRASPVCGDGPSFALRHSTNRLPPSPRCGGPAWGQACPLVGILNLEPQRGRGRRP